MFFHYDSETLVPEPINQEILIQVILAGGHREQTGAQLGTSLTGLSREPGKALQHGKGWVSESPLGDSYSPQGPMQDWQWENPPSPCTSSPSLKAEAKSHVDILQGQILSPTVSLKASGPKASHHWCHSPSRGHSHSAWKQQDCSTPYSLDKTQHQLPAQWFHFCVNSTSGCSLLVSQEAPRC